MVFEKLRRHSHTVITATADPNPCLTNRWLWIAQEFVYGNLKIFRIQNPTVPRAGQLGAGHGGAAGRSRARRSQAGRGGTGRGGARRGDAPREQWYISTARTPCTSVLDVPSGVDDCLVSSLSVGLRPPFCGFSCGPVPVLTSRLSCPALFETVGVLNFACASQTSLLKDFGRLMHLRRSCLFCF